MCYGVGGAVQKFRGRGQPFVACRILPNLYMAPAVKAGPRGDIKMMWVWVIELFLIINLVYCFVKIKNDFSINRYNFAILGIFAALGVIAAMVALVSLSRLVLIYSLAQELNHI